MIFKKVKNFLLKQIIQDYQKFFDMSAPTDAVWIVRELLEEIIGMAHFRKVQEEFEAKKGDVKSEVKEEHDWVNLIDAEEQEMIGGDCDCDTDCNCEVVKPVDKDATLADCDFCFGKCICDKESGNQRDIVIEKKEEKFPEYATMGFNWKEVEPIFKGQLEKMDDATDDFRDVYIGLIDGFSA